MSMRKASVAALDVIPMTTEVLFEALADRARVDVVRSRLMETVDLHTALHLAVMREPYLQLLLDGQKTIESRFSINRVSPFEDVDAGDILALKQSSGPVVGLAVVEHAAFYELDPPTWQLLRAQFAGPLCAEDDDFWTVRVRARYATLITVEHVHRIDPIRVKKRDRRAWVRFSRSIGHGQLPF